MPEDTKTRAVATVTLIVVADQSEQLVGALQICERALQPYSQTIELAYGRMTPVVPMSADLYASLKGRSESNQLSSRTEASN